MKKKLLSEILNETGELRENYFHSIAPPIIQASNFSFDTVEEFRTALQNESEAVLYSRGNNPTVDILRKKLAALDNAEDSLVLNSGASAIFASVVANVASGDHIISVRKPYGWAQHLFEKFLPRFGVSTTYVDGTNVKNFEEAIRPETKIIYLESPNSWTFELQDLKAVAALAKDKGILTICDNSYCSPLYQRPIDYGIDISFQSATKYLNGHSDVVAGVISGTKEMMHKIFSSEYMTAGLGITPFHAWLMIRGLRTLPLRLKKSAETARLIVSYLKTQLEVESIAYPFDPLFPQYSLAKAQMEDTGGLFSFVLKADSIEKIERFCEGMQHILMAVSWGGYESLVMPSIAGKPGNTIDLSDPEHRRIRMYIGIEEPEYLIEDIARGFAAMKKA
ncbi:MAG: PLP-dependent aspartate aminotransferase family protein [Chitinophagaceae bacterium]|nr:PLP-dependent aspartate aminotransferase family protein [Chitinophagaceae bacterium]